MGLNDHQTDQAPSFLTCGDMAMRSSLTSDRT